MPLASKILQGDSRYTIVSVVILKISLARLIESAEMAQRCMGALACLLPMWPGFDSLTRHHMWVEFVGSLFRGPFESPENFSRKAICKPANRLFKNADLSPCFQGDKKQTDSKV